MRPLNVYRKGNKEKGGEKGYWFFIYFLISEGKKVKRRLEEIRKRDYISSSALLVMEKCKGIGKKKGGEGNVTSLSSL